LREIAAPFSFSQESPECCFYTVFIAKKSRSSHVEFEDACKRLHMPMTAQANLLMREFVNRQKQARDEPNDFNDPIGFYSGIDDAL
jgi:hypothetical protein